jgi:hypothetical protein
LRSDRAAIRRLRDDSYNVVEMGIAIRRGCRGRRSGGLRHHRMLQDS